MPLKGNFKKNETTKLILRLFRTQVSVIQKQPCGVIPAVKSILQLTSCFSEETAVE